MTSTAATMKGTLLTGVLIILSSVCAMAADAGNALWNKANQLFQQKQYDSALACYEQVAATHPGIAEVYYNLGNTYYRLNQVAPAILNYERALHINPDHKEARENLLLTQNRISNHIQAVPEIFFIEWWHNLTKASAANIWAILSLITFVTIVLIMLVSRTRKTGVTIVPPQLMVILVLVWICILTLAYFSATNVSNSNKAVVMQHDAPLMNTDLKGKPVSLIPEGTTIKTGSIRGEYIEAILPDGHKGWIQLSLINKI